MDKDHGEWEGQQEPWKGRSLQLPDASRKQLEGCAREKVDVSFSSLPLKRKVDWWSLDYDTFWEERRRSLLQDEWRLLWNLSIQSRMKNNIILIFLITIISQF